MGNYFVTLNFTYCSIWTSEIFFLFREMLSLDRKISLFRKRHFRGRLVLSFYVGIFKITLQLMRFQSQKLYQVKSLLLMWGKLKREVGNLVVLSSCFCPVWYETAIFSSHQKTMKGFYLQHFSKIISLLNKKGKTHLRYDCSIGPQYIRSLVSALNNTENLQPSSVVEVCLWRQCHTYQCFIKSKPF